METPSAELCSCRRDKHAAAVCSLLTRVTDRQTDGFPAKLDEQLLLRNAQSINQSIKNF